MLLYQPRTTDQGTSWWVLRPCRGETHNGWTAHYEGYHWRSQENLKKLTLIWQMSLKKYDSLAQGKHYSLSDQYFFIRLPKVVLGQNG